MKKRILAILTVLVFALSMLPSFSVMAAVEPIATFEAEDYKAVNNAYTTTRTYESSDGATIVARCGAAETGVILDFGGINYPAGEYNVKLVVASLHSKTVTLYVNGEEKATPTVTPKTAEIGYNSFYELNLGTFVFTEAENVITLKMVNSTYIDKLIIEDVEASLPSIQGSNATLKIEAEDMDRTGGYQKTFADDSNKKFIWCGSGEASFKAEAGTYLLQVGCFSRFGNKLTVTINDGTTLEVLPSKYWTDSTALTSMTSDAVEIHEYPVTLNEGKNTISISFTNNAALDYIVISNVADYHKEVYSYSLKDANIRTGRRWGMVESYLGEYNVNDDSSWQTTLPNTTTKALSKADVSHVYYPFETTVDSDYYVKVTYASAEASKAVVIVDPTDPATTLPYKSSDTWDYDAVGGTKIENGTWQSTYSGSEGTFTAPYFTEKIFYIGKLSGGSHNLAFVVNPDQTENKGVAIRKVELISSDNIENEIYFTTAQMIAENVGAEVQTSALVTTPEAANTFSSASAADDDKNTAATVGYVYNYTDDTLEFVYITASYNDDLLVDAVMSEVIPVAPGADANLKAKVSTIGATGVVTYIWEAGTLVPIKEVTPFDY